MTTRVLRMLAIPLQVPYKTTSQLQNTVQSKHLEVTGAFDINFHADC